MEQGGDEDTAGFEKMMKEMGGMPGMGGGKSPEEMQREVETLQAVSPRIHGVRCARERIILWRSCLSVFEDAGPGPRTWILLFAEGMYVVEGLAGSSR